MFSQSCFMVLVSWLFGLHRAENVHLEVGDATDNVKCNLKLWISSSRVLLRALQMVIVDENIFEKITKRNIF